MHAPTLTNVFSTAVALLPLLVSGAPVTSLAKRQQPELLGSLTWYPQRPDLVLASIRNTSPVHYAILTKNNLFDDLYPYRPLSVSNLPGGFVTLVGTRFSYPSIDDSQFRDFPPGTIWERYFNMSQYMPSYPEIQGQESRCFSFQLPKDIEALVIGDAQAKPRLADLFLTQGLARVSLISNPLHMNVTISQGNGTTNNGVPGAREPIPQQPAGVFLLPSEQTGQVVNTFQNLSPATSQPFIIGEKKLSSVKAIPEVVAT
ncbi:MAG: hypothetical protein Q9178_003869 [Gyalolechia marmorata]